MSILPRVLSIYNYLNQISIGDVNRFLKIQVNPRNLQNIINNKVLYPGSLATTKTELEINLAIIAAIISKYPETLYKQNQLLITTDLLEFFPSLEDFLEAIIPALNLKEVTKVLVKRNEVEVVGCIVRPDLDLSVDKIWLNGETLQVKKNQINFLSAKAKAQIVEIGENQFEVVGGNLGIVVDLRKNK